MFKVDGLLRPYHSHMTHWQNKRDALKVGRMELFYEPDRQRQMEQIELSIKTDTVSYFETIALTRGDCVSTGTSWTRFWPMVIIRGAGVDRGGGRENAKPVSVSGQLAEGKASS